MLFVETAKEVSECVENNWIRRYPRPTRCLSDQGPEFASEFTAMLERYGIEHDTSAPRNPQGNSINERIHQSIENVLRIVVASENPRSLHEGQQVIKKTLAIAMHACHCATNTSIGNFSSGGLPFIEIGLWMFLLLLM